MNLYVTWHLLSILFILHLDFHILCVFGNSHNLNSVPMWESRSNAASNYRSQSRSHSVLGDWDSKIERKVIDVHAKSTPNMFSEVKEIKLKKSSKHRQKRSDQSTHQHDFDMKKVTVSSQTKLPFGYKGDERHLKMSKHIDKTVFQRFDEMQIHCLPVSEAAAERGYFRILQDNTFQVDCDKGKTRPLLTYHNWTCDPEWLMQEELFIPTMCIKKALPTLVRIEREWTISGLAASKCGRMGDLALVEKEWVSLLTQQRKKTFFVDGFVFFFNLVPSGGECSGYFEVDSKFRINVNVTFQVFHKPRQFFFKQNTRGKAQQVLDSVVTTLFSTLLRKHLILDFESTKEDLKFQAIECKDRASRIQKNEQYFDKEIPSCRFCDRGFFLCNVTFLCHRCPRGTYAPSGVRDSCLPCPLTESMRSVSADSLMDCYSISLEAYSTWMAFIECTVIVGSYHFVCFIVVMWNLRNALPSSKDVEIEDRDSSTKQTF